MMIRPSRTIGQIAVSLFLVVPMLIDFEVADHLTLLVVIMAIIYCCYLVVMVFILVVSLRARKRMVTRMPPMQPETLVSIAYRLRQLRAQKDRPTGD